MWILIEIVILCGRADFMLNNGSDYEAHILKTGELVYFKSELWNLGKDSRHKVGCPYDLEESYPAPDSTCRYWFIPLNANLVSQGWVQFSLGVGLIVAILFRIIALGCKLFYDSIERVHDSVAAALFEGICGWFLITIVELILHFQQFISLLPIEVILPNAYCLEVQVPVATMKAICRYKIAAAAIPIGLPMSIGGFGFSAFCWSMISDCSDERMKGIVFLCGFVGVIFGMYGLTFVIFWLFGGIVLGFWYVYGCVTLGYITSDTNLILVLMSSTVFILLIIEQIIKIWSSGCRNYKAAKVAAEAALDLGQLPLE